jgi:hypothetical protein
MTPHHHQPTFRRGIKRQIASSIAQTGLLATTVVPISGVLFPARRRQFVPCRFPQRGEVERYGA